MKIFSYIVARDYGFAPNPFFGYCTLATCKPQLRAKAMVGDWIIGTGAKGKYDLAGHLIYAMRVDEILDFNTYWNDPRFACKRPMLNGSLKQLYGDNIYHSQGQQWIQVNSHHSLDDGKPNPRNIEHDTSVDRMLVSRMFVYYGDAAVLIPNGFRPYKKTSEDLCCSTQGHRILSTAISEAFVNYLEESGRWGLQGVPLEFSRNKKADD
ncbi:Nmad2 family putative nucleotide modification protein [Nitrospira sp. Ecomares 2.1]